jgi:arylsulfatase A-like enzyme
VDYDAADKDITQETGLKAFYQSLGIDDLTLQDGKSCSLWFYDDYSRMMEAEGQLAAYRFQNGDKLNNRAVFDFPCPAEYHPDVWVADRAAEYIKDYKGEAPLFSWISISGPHYPFDAPAEYHNRVDMSKLPLRSFLAGEFDDPSRVHHTSMYGPQGIDACSRLADGACRHFDDTYWERLRRNYHANVALIDDKVGDILAAVRERFGDDALIVFTTDHGELLGDHGLWGKNNCAYEPVWKVPLLVKYPGQSEEGRSNAGHASRTEKVSTLDILPTFLKAAGLPREGLEGLDFMEWAERGGREYILAEGEGYVAVTDGTFKYVHVQQGKKNLRELYDLSRDPGEFHNYIENAEHGDVLNRLRDRVIEHFMVDVLP